MSIGFNWWSTHVTGACGLHVYIKVSPGAWMTWVSQMTASSPTPQQQNRWKGRRCLAAALIPQPAAYPPKHICCSLPRHLFHTLSVGRRPQQAATNTAFSRSSERLVFQVVSKNTNKQKISRRRGLLSPLRTQSTRGVASLRHTSGPHIASGRSCVRVNSLKGRQQIPQWAVATGGDMLWAPSLSLLLFLFHTGLSLHVATRRRQTQILLGLKRRAELCHLNFFFAFVYSEHCFHSEKYSPWPEHGITFSTSRCTHSNGAQRAHLIWLPGRGYYKERVNIQHGCTKCTCKDIDMQSVIRCLVLNCLVHAKLPVWLRIGWACQVASGTFGIGCF